MNARLIAVTGCALLLTAAGCSGSGDEAEPSATASATSATASSTATSSEADGGGGETSASGPTSATPPPLLDCTVSQLDTQIRDGGGAAAGSTSFLIAFTNVGGTTCKLGGFPGVSYTSGPYSYPVGAPASRTGDPLGTVELKDGETATATVVAVNVMNYPPQDCGPVPVPGIHVYPPNSYEAVYLDYSSTACSKTSAQQLSVTAVSVPQN